MGGAFAAFFAIMLWKLNPLLEPLRQPAHRLRGELADLPVPDDAADPPRGGPGRARRRRGARHLRAAVRLPGPGAGQLGRRVRGYSFLSVAGQPRSAPPWRSTGCWPSSAPACWRWRCSMSCCATRAWAAPCGPSPSIRSRPAWSASTCEAIPRSPSPPAGRSPPSPACSSAPSSRSAPRPASIYTLKALIVVIMAGVGRVTGTLAAGLLLGVVRVGRRLSRRSRRSPSPSTSRCSCWCCCVRPTGLFTRA